MQSDGTRCNLIDGGKTTDSAECGRDKQIVTDLLGSGRGSPGWNSDFDSMSPGKRMDQWISAASEESLTEGP